MQQKLAFIKEPKMTPMKKIGSLIFMFSCMLQPLSAFLGCGYTFDSEYEITLGYRLDELTASSRLFCNNTSLGSNRDIRVNNINIIELGLKARWVLYDHWLLKASAAGGVTNHGKYKQSEFDGLSCSGPVDLHVCKGNSRDASAALGYVFRPYCDFEIIPLIGLSYDYLRVSMEDSKTDLSSSFDRFEGLTYKSKWIGPWVGLDGRYTYKCFNFAAGYEYHWSRWKGNMDTPKYCNHRELLNDCFKTNDACGNIGYVSAGWNVNSCIYAGLELKFQYWKAHTGRECRQEICPSRDSYRSNHHSRDRDYSRSYDRCSENDCSRSCDRCGDNDCSRSCDRSIDNDCSRSSDRSCDICRSKASFSEYSDYSDYSDYSFFDRDRRFLDDVSNFYDNPNDLFSNCDDDSDTHSGRPGPSMHSKVIGRLKSATWKSFSVTFELRNTF